MTCLQLKTKLRSLYWAQNVFSFSANRSSTSYPIGVPNQESSLIKGGRQKQPANCLGPHSFRKATFIVSGNGKGVACPMHVSFHLTLKPLSHSLTCSQAPTIILHLNQAVCKSRPMDSLQLEALHKSKKQSSIVLGEIHPDYKRESCGIQGCLSSESKTFILLHTLSDWENGNLGCWVFQKC